MARVNTIIKSDLCPHSILLEIALYLSMDQVSSMFEAGKKKVQNITEGHLPFPPIGL